MSIPKRILPSSLAEYLAVMSQAVFQAGLSWAAIDAMWDSLTEAFLDWAPEKVAKFSDRDIKRIMGHPGILHSERKIRATIRNAQTMLELERKYKGFQHYLRSFKSYNDLAGDLKDRFSYVGDISVYYFLFRVDETVPPYSRWIKTVEGEHPRIQEMVEKG